MIRPRAPRCQDRNRKSSGLHGRTPSSVSPASPRRPATACRLSGIRWPHTAMRVRRPTRRRHRRAHRLIRRRSTRPSRLSSKPHSESPRRPTQRSRRPSIPPLGWCVISESSTRTRPYSPRSRGDSPVRRHHSQRDTDGRDGALGGTGRHPCGRRGSPRGNQRRDRRANRRAAHARA